LKTRHISLEYLTVIHTNTDYGTALSGDAVQKIQELKGPMNRYSYHHTNPDEIIKWAIFNSINDDDTLLNGMLEQLRSILAISKTLTFDISTKRLSQ